MLEQVALIMETELFFSNLVTILQFGFLDLFVMLNLRICKYFSFRLTRKPYPKSCQISTMGSVIKSSVAHILRRAEKNEYLRSGSYF